MPKAAARPKRSRAPHAPEDPLIARVEVWRAASAAADRAAENEDWPRQERLDRWCDAERARLAALSAQTQAGVLAKIDLALALLSPVERGDCSGAMLASARADLAALIALLPREREKAAPRNAALRLSAS